nr:MAG TPA: hypothetical protein [Caudoviricetes sp.]DAZ75536.1 MAG TPA: hypothetical protein [Caudoviricetes sp.]
MTIRHKYIIITLSKDNRRMPERKVKDARHGNDRQAV